MGLLSGLLGLPLAPVRGVVWVADVIRQQAEKQYYDPAEIRRGRVRFRIEARLRVEPAPEVEFETLLELATGAVQTWGQEREKI